MSGVPSGVDDQSVARIRAAISEFPGNRESLAEGAVSARLIIQRRESGLGGNECECVIRRMGAATSTILRDANGIAFASFRSDYEALLTAVAAER